MDNNPRYKTILIRQSNPQNACFDFRFVKRRADDIVQILLQIVRRRSARNSKCRSQPFRFATEAVSVKIANLAPDPEQTTRWPAATHPPGEPCGAFDWGAQVRFDFVTYVIFLDNQRFDS